MPGEISFETSLDNGRLANIFLKHLNPAANSAAYGSSPEKLAAMQKEYAGQRTGFFTSNMAEAGAFLRTDSSQQLPNIQCFFLPYLVPEAPAESSQPIGHGRVGLFPSTCKRRDGPEDFFPPPADHE